MTTPQQKHDAEMEKVSTKNSNQAAADANTKRTTDAERARELETKNIA